MNQPRYGKRAPTEETHQSALQLRKALFNELRKALFNALEAAMDNDWPTVTEACEKASLIAKHCHTQESGFDTRPEKEAWAESNPARVDIEPVSDR